MLFGGKKHFTRLRGAHAVAMVRDVVEVLAIVAAGIWAFYVFAYENRIKPSMATPDVDVSASLQRLSERNGLIGIGLHIRLHNAGTVNAHFLGLAVNVYGQRIVPGAPKGGYPSRPLQYRFDGFFRAQTYVPVYSIALVTHLGDPKSSQDNELDPGTVVNSDWTFYVPRGRFDLLTVGIDAPYTKYENATIPTHLRVLPKGDVTVVTENSPHIVGYAVRPVTSLDIR